ncbi:hypothetical protein O6H91_06G015000 [Diphasiastrum complanatum]|uniref:Uncharacterized protein n=1 Tax=Diphasiastrum complanatum TaxID=34168 RepID=A0ACC2DBA3_DIPCM|nr:hypothetical protein O6H91_06G015000 [Diphasiastrum complanatum]
MEESQGKGENSKRNGNPIHSGKQTIQFDVEESFNIQAIHDILYHRQEIGRYDHLEFSGVVPRTFIGALVVSILSSPFIWVTNLLKLPKIYSLHLVRLTLGSITLATFYSLRVQISKHFGRNVCNAFTLLTTVQFHLLFYCSRPLPNIFALCLVNLSYTFWMRKQPRSTLGVLIFAMIVFRCDVLLLLVPIGLTLLLTKSISFWDAVKSCAIMALLSIVATVLVDSVMWQRWLWPEMEVFWFNTFLNRSAEWGVFPFHWYFTSALPRSMLAAYPLALVGILLEQRVRQYVFPVLGFVILYSKLPHKELRFVLPSLPILNMAAAIALSRIYLSRWKPRWTILYRGCVLMLLASVGYTMVTSIASYANYPGGQALEMLHKIDANTSNSIPRIVHIDVLPAMTGISRFCEKGPPWSYSKEEGISLVTLTLRNFTYLLNAHSDVPTFKCLLSVGGFSGIELQWSFPPVKLKRNLKVHIHGREESSGVHTDKWPGCIT